MKIKEIKKDNPKFKMTQEKKNMKEKLERARIKELKKRRYISKSRKEEMNEKEWKY